MKRLLLTSIASMLLLTGCSERLQVTNVEPRRCHVEDVTVQVIRQDDIYLSNELTKFLTDDAFLCKLGVVSEWITIGSDGTTYKFVSETWDCTKCSSWN